MDTANPDVVYEQSLYPDYITVGSGFMTNFILDPFFKENTYQGLKKYSITGTCYCDLLQE